MPKALFVSKALLGLSLVVATPSALHAQTYPTRPVTMVVTYPAGGPADTVGRLWAQVLSTRLGQPVLVENVGGAGGTIGLGRVAKAAPDGYTLMLGNLGQVTAVSLYRKLAYHPVDAFDAIGMIAEIPYMVVGRKDLPARNVSELLAYIRANGQQVTYANAGTASGSHLCGLLLMSTLKTQMNVISYRGSGPAMTDVIGQRIDVFCDQTITAVGPIKSGTIKGYAVTTRSRVSSVPDLPTMQEAGLKDFDLFAWYGLAAPKGLTKPVLDRLSQALQAGLSDSAFVGRLSEVGAQPASRERATAENFTAYMRAEVAKWSPIIEAAGVYAD